MKRFLCAILAVCMLCGAAAFVGCKKDSGNNNSSSSSSKGNNDNVNGAPEGWENPEAGGKYENNWGLE